MLETQYITHTCAKHSSEEWKWELSLIGQWKLSMWGENTKPVTKFKGLWHATDTSVTFLKAARSACIAYMTVRND